MSTKRVDFFIVGAMRSGTSSIRDALAKNPYICMAHGEPKFFSNHTLYARGLEFYHSLFERKEPALISGEKSPTYAVSKHAPNRIYEYNPDAKIIWILRHPVKRAISHAAHSKYRTEEALSMSDAVARRHELERSQSTMAYIYRSQYEKHIEQWCKYFPMNQQRILILEEVIEDQRAALNNIHEFLDVPIHGAVSFPHVHRPQVSDIAKRNPIDDDVRKEIGRILEPTVSAVESILGRRLEVWRS